jgi:hypothetical protein
MLCVAVALAGLLAAVAAELVDRELSPRPNPGLAVAVFGTFLTSISIIAAFAIDRKSRWPTPWEMLGRARVLPWFLIALASVVAALLASASGDAFLDSLSITLALVAVPLGALGLWGLVSLSSDRGRRKLVVDLLARSIRSAEPPAGGEEADLGEIDTEDHVPTWFLGSDPPRPPRLSGVSIELVPSTLRLYADRRDSEAIVRLIDEVHAAAVAALGEGGWGKLDDRLGRIDRLLFVQRSVFEELAWRVLSGRLGDVTARGPLALAGETAIDVAGRARDPRAWPDSAGRRRVETLVARHLTALCRLAGAAAAQADSRLRPGSSGLESARLAALRTACDNLQQAARWAVDPDPPGMKMPPDHPWRSGLSDPESALVWLWSAAESPSGPFGVGLYALCQILTGRKFFGSYWDGIDVFAEIERRLARPEDDSAAAVAGRAALERAGGLPLASLEVAAMRLAATPPRHLAAGDGGQRIDDRHVASNLFLAGGGYKPAGRDPVEDLAWLLTDRLDGSLWTMVGRQLARLPDPVLPPPLRPLHRRPEACALAVCLRLTPLSEGDEEALDELRSFVAALPDALLEGTVTLALRLVRSYSFPLRPIRAEHERELIEATQFVRKVVPGPLPATEKPSAGMGGAAGDGATPARAPARPAAASGAPKGFEQALAEIAAGGPEVEVDLIQCDPRWLDEWADLRARLDAALLDAALRGRARVRRVLLFGLSGDADRRLTRLHYRWKDALSTAVGCFEASPGGRRAAPSPYQARLLILPFDDSGVAPPPDCVVVRGGGGEPGRDGKPAGDFESLWAGFDPGVRIAAGGLGLTELGGRSALADSRAFAPAP